MLTDFERSCRTRLRDDFIYYASKCLKIRNKDGRIVNFALNKAQLHIHQQLEMQKGQTGKIRAIVLKGRQQGCSTYIGGRFYHKTTHTTGIQSFILTHSLDATNNLFKMAQRFHENCPEIVRPSVGAHNSKELVFNVLDSGYKLGTAENKNVGRSSTIQLFHGSEVGFWSNASEHAKGLLQAIPPSLGTEVILESTANGVGNYFHQEWQKAEAGQSDFVPIFVPWYWQDEYSRVLSEGFTITSDERDLQHLYDLTLEQLCWRRAKIIEMSVSGQDGEKVFRQEYPNCPQEAFLDSGDDNYISPELVARARKCEEVEPYGPLLLGIDPARFGDDRSAIIRRRGRVAYGLESYIKKDTMEITGIVNRIIESENPVKVFVDVGGLGAGVVDRLNELGHRDRVIAVNAGSKSLDDKKYGNKRAEMWGNLQLWLQDEPVKIPDEDSLHADLCGVKYKYDSNSRLMIEKKEDMKRRGIRSCDEADALCLTFALPVKALESKKEDSTNKLLSNLAQKSNALSRARGQRDGYF